MKPSSSSRKLSKASRSRDEERQVARLYKTVHQQKLIYERWVSGAESTVSTGAGGLVALTGLANAAGINVTPDFASLAALYTAYRCKAIRVELLPFLPVPVYNGAVLITQPTAIAVFPWTTNTVPTTFSQAQDTTGVKMVSGYSRAIVATSWKGDPDAHLWTGTGSAIGSNEQFGISCIGTATAATVNNSVFKVLPWYLVEFRMAG